MVVGALVELAPGDEEAVGVVVEGVAFDLRGDFEEVVDCVAAGRAKVVAEVDDVGLAVLDGDGQCRGTVPEDSLLV